MSDEFQNQKFSFLSLFLSSSVGQRTCVDQIKALVAAEKLAGQPLVGQFRPDCDASGSYKLKQCHQSTGFCWCVDKQSGQQHEGTKKRGNVDCSKSCLIYFK